MTYGTKSAIKAAYLAGLVETYAWAQGDTLIARKGLAAAEKAVDGALAGKLKLEGDIWFKALAANGVQKGASRALIAGLPA